MRIALFSDVHANVPALEVVLDDIARRAEVVATYQLGDLVGYAPWPNEVVGMIRAAGIAGIAGNYDSTVAADHPHCGCRYEDPRQEALAHVSYAWTRAHVSRETKRWLGGLPFRLDVRPFGGHAAGPMLTLLHGNQVLNTVYVTADRSDDFLAKLGRGVGAKAGDVIACGHTHVPWHRVVDGVHFLNTGSVGRPKDGDPRAAWVLLDLSDRAVRVEIRRVPYDVERASRAIVEAGLPEEFARVLANGGDLDARA